MNMPGTQKRSAGGAVSLNDVMQLLAEWGKKNIAAE